MLWRLTLVTQAGMLVPMLYRETQLKTEVEGDGSKNRGDLGEKVEAIEAKYGQEKGEREE